jgi:hypothetical protein
MGRKYGIYNVYDTLGVEYFVRRMLVHLAYSEFKWFL